MKRNEAIKPLHAIKVDSSKGIDGLLSEGRVAFVKVADSPATYRSFSGTTCDIRRHNKEG
jgi:hypothetical protein